jgi:lysine 2,3-aminomutase
VNDMTAISSPRSQTDPPLLHRHSGESRNPSQTVGGAQAGDAPASATMDPGFPGGDGNGQARRETLRSPAALAAAGLTPPERVTGLEEVASRYAVAITPAMVDLIDPADANDPIARQFLPEAAELETTAEERADPIGDDVHEVTPRLIHRYPDRVLLKLVSACAVYCRFCFRRETVGQGEAMSRADLDRALRYISEHPDIWEVIVSGGDPLVASPRRLKALTASLAAIDHVKVVRFHTRVPVVAPDRITPEMVAALKADGATTWIAIHANHPRELTAEARAALAYLADAGIPLVSQTVLLRGVNDDAATLSALMRAFVECRVRPYYLHHADLAPGTSHFRTTIAEGQALMRAMRGRVSGLCQPTYVLDMPGGHGKVPVGPGYLRADGGGVSVEDFSGQRHAYRATAKGSAAVMQMSCEAAK